MVRDTGHNLTPRQLIAIERLCDQFERDLLAGKMLEIRSLVATAPPDIKTRLRIELTRILKQHRAADGVPSGSAVPAEDAIYPQNTFGRFQLEAICGRGSTGDVWRAFDPALGRWVALKVSLPDSVIDRERFVREAQSVAKLSHPNIVPVYEAGDIGDRCFLVSEFVEGQTLAQMLTEGPMEPQAAVALVLQVTDAVQHCHAAGIVHRDLKPANVMIAADGTARVTDFGLAKNLNQDHTLTREGTLVGTPGYMAPEQARGDARESDERTDVYSIGVVLFELLTGAVPFIGSFERTVFQVVHSPAPNAKHIDDRVPADLAAICSRCLEKSPDQRFASAAELADELKRFAAGLPIKTRPVSIMGRYSRWLSREPKLAWAVTAAVSLLFFAAVTATWSAISLNAAWQNEQQLVRAERKALSSAIDARNKQAEARRLADEARAEATLRESEARRRAADGRKAVDFLATLFTPVDLIGGDHGPSPIEPVRPLSEATILTAAKQVDALLADDPVVAARVKGILANAARSSGRFGTADVLLADVERLRERTDVGDVLPTDRATTLLYHAYLDHARGHVTDAEARYRGALNLQNKVVQSGLASNLDRLRLAQMEFGIGCLLLRNKKNRSGKPFLERALKTRKELLPAGDALRVLTELVMLQAGEEPPDTATVTRLLTQCDSHLPAQVMQLYWSIIDDRRQKDFVAATTGYERLISVIEGTIGSGSSLHILALGDLSGMLRESGDHKRAYDLARRVIDDSRELDADHPQRIRAMMTLAFELQLAERFDESKQLLDEVNQYAPNGGRQSEAFNLGLAWCHLHEGTAEAGLVNSAKPLANVGRVTAAQTAWYCYTHARLLEAAGRPGDARGYYDKATGTINSMLRMGRLPKHSTWLKRTAIVLTHHNRHAEAEPVYRAAVDWCVKEYFDNHPRVAGVRYRLALCLESQGKRTEAALVARQALLVQEARLPEDDRRITNSKVLLRRLLAAGKSNP